MEFVPVNLSDTLDLCVAFRKDAYAVSYGNVDDFSVSGTKAWFEKISQESDAGFFHAAIDNKIVGQIEFRSNLVDDSGIRYGYINLLYLTPEYRGKGLGQKLQSFIFERLKQDNCQYALLMYLPANTQGVAFYRKHGWIDIGAVEARGQLAEIKLV